MAGLSHKLTSLVQAEDQPELYLYVCVQIGLNVPYSFARASSPRQVLTWMRLLAQVQRGELEP